MDIEQSIMNLIFNQETVFFALFMYLFYSQQKEKKQQSDFITKQQDILNSLTNSFEKLSDNQEKLTERIEKIEFNIEEIKNGGKD